MPNVSRRKLLQSGAGLLGGAAMVRSPLAWGLPPDWTQTYGLSTFGELAESENFKAFSYVNPDAPKGGALAIQITSTQGNQAFDTFDTLNIYVLKGNGAAGMDATYDSLMAGSADEPTSAYGLIARAVQISADKLTYRFLLRPEARFHDGSKLTAEDVAFSLNTLKTRGHPVYRIMLDKMVSAEADPDGAVVVKLAKDRSRDLHLVISGMPVFSKDYWQGRDFEAATQEPPLGSGPYRFLRMNPGTSIEFARVADYWAKDLPVNRGQNNFDVIRYEYYREQVAGFEAFKAGKLNYHEEFSSKVWNTGYDFPALVQGRVKKQVVHSGRPIPTQGWYFNTRRAKFADPRVREAIGMLFDFEWTNKNIMYSAYKRLVSLFQNQPMMATGKPGPQEMALLAPFRDKLSAQVLEEAYLPPVSDGSGSDRNWLRKANDLLLAAGCKRQGAVLLDPQGQPFTIEFLDFSDALQPHTQPFQANLRRLGIAANSRIVDSSQYQMRVNKFDFDVITVAVGSTTTPGDELRNSLGSKAADTPGARNYSGVKDAVIDALVDRISHATSRDELNVAARALDRVYRVGHYWVPMWYRDNALLAYWDEFDRPKRQPTYDTGAPGTWWYDSEKAKKIGLP